MNNKTKTSTDPPQTMCDTYNNESTTTEAALERTAAYSQTGGGGGVGAGLNAFYWLQIFALDSVVFITQTLFSSHGGFLTYAMHHHREPN